MAIVRSSMFNLFKDKIQALPSPLSEEDLRSQDFLLDQDERNRLEIFYAPFEYINTEAKILIAGITPGMHQMQVAFQTVWDLQNESLTDEEILREVKKRSSFEGTMRKNLVAMLDELGLNEQLGIRSTIELFGEANGLVQTSSILPHAVFFAGKNYNGSRPDPLKTELLRTYIETYFAKDHAMLKSPLIIPLGVNVSRVIEELVKDGWQDDSHVLKTFPHPSGSNGHRHRQFAENKEKMRQDLARFFN
ncbi:uracil-DNA glycosylase family protein [Bacillus sp. B-jedd]|uniref:uracil-DNA glycosylase family protein n=1 Tax=Bacillus sp. B-jedd TaxID=1476857 RepID=UPI0005156845|nr:hypothetical protein [Bacillus sp. B-jedd]CEG27035.1 hypothetical protein BN1002_01891 [Bacillus sp. B-jedd]